MRLPGNPTRYTVTAVVMIGAIIVCSVNVLNTHADVLSNRSLQLISSAPGATTSYTVTFTIINSAPVGAFKLQLCANSPLPQDTCDPPIGLDMSSATLSDQKGLTDFSIDQASTNSLLLTRPPATVSTPLPVSLTFDAIINPSASGSYYGRFSTYSSSGDQTPIDTGGTALAIVDNLSLTSKVPPYLNFCSAISIGDYDCSQANGDYVDFGELSSTQAKSGQSQLLVATNAGEGYNVQMNGNTLTSNNDVIAALSIADTSRPGTSQFGLNLRANTSPRIGTDPSGPGSGTPTAAYNRPDYYLFRSNDSIIYSPHADAERLYTLSYIANVPATQPAGIYVSTLTYVCSANF